MKYDLGLVVGRFQPLHLGHQEIIDAALEKCERVAVFVGSVQECNTERNPYTYEFRCELLKQIYGDKIDIWPLRDLGVGDNTRWGDYILKNVYAHYEKRPNAMIYGNDGVRARWFKNQDISDIAQIVVDRKGLPISATMVREALKNDDRALWETYTDPRLYPYYNIEKNSLR